jgi:hypothetical protein
MSGREATIFSELVVRNSYTFDCENPNDSVAIEFYNYSGIPHNNNTSHLKNLTMIEILTKFIEKIHPQLAECK